MKPSMLDTDILSEFFRGNPKVIAKVDQYLKEHGYINLSIITYYEMLNGLLYKDAKKQLERFEAFIELNKVIPLSFKMAKTAAVIKADLRKRGTEIGHTRFFFYQPLRYHFKSMVLHRRYFRETNNLTNKETTKK